MRLRDGGFSPYIHLAAAYQRCLCKETKSPGGRRDPALKNHLQKSASDLLYESPWSDPALKNHLRKSAPDLKVAIYSGTLPLSHMPPTDTSGLTN